MNNEGPARISSPLYHCGLHVGGIPIPWPVVPRVVALLVANCPTTTPDWKLIVHLEALPVDEAGLVRLLYMSCFLYIVATQSTVFIHFPAYSQQHIIAFTPFTPFIQKP
jgi:hypothetical protein